MIIKFLSAMWKIIDLVCYLAALAFIIWGCFLIGKTLGIFSIGISLILIGLATEYYSSQSN
ncbi:DUF1056 family protein [Limosilactobacillus reuteri]|uniref:DUF1056 family protein n=1 Tax=Limosilactobacillus TaxID=2742598 RepID=UPI0015FAEF1D|nr:MULTISPECIES: DUF1056 family protein [Limosilactobacillus]MBB1099888.1 DUF1056 family protein [Limosilactobacillus agrestis]MCC4323660.1 DUF1056 family protein [Limosilactobacillus reuteri]MCC4333926.1 DUF1056 family protein [Limosilactobacillus reuteri]MCC4396343.1 DUF1056 family protein [Limosilactobacillus reuteri]MCC4402349.1 DUF1056 family protein [Limosilactobacillus reuteri]